MTAVVHIAGLHVQVGPMMRQRCAWCGAVIIDYDLTGTAVPVGQDPHPAVWPLGGVVAMEGVATWLVDHQEGQPLPNGSCVSVDPSVTI